MVREVRGMGMEVCTTLGMLSPEQARQLKEAYVSGDSPCIRLLSIICAEDLPHTITILTLLENFIPRWGLSDAGVCDKT